STSTAAVLKTLNASASTEGIAFSPDGTMLAVGNSDNTVKIFNVSSGALMRTLTGHTFFIAGIGWSPDRSMVAAGSWDTTIRIWNASTGAFIRSLSNGGEDPVYAAAWSKDGTKIAGGGGDFDGVGRVRIWDAATGSLLHTLDGHEAATFHLEFA